MTPRKEYENHKKRITKMVSKSKHSPKEERSVRFKNINPETTDSRADG